MTSRLIHPSNDYYTWLGLEAVVINFIGEYVFMKTSCDILPTDDISCQIILVEKSEVRNLV